jgi:hypothetical protein
MATDLERKTQQAFINWFGVTSTHSVTIGLTARHAEEDDTDTKTLPALWVKADRQAELSPGTGVFQLTVDVVLECNLDDTTEATMAQYMDDITDLVQWDTLATMLSNQVAAFTVYGIESRGPCSKEIDGRITRRTYPITLWAHEGD